LNNKWNIYDFSDWILKYSRDSTISVLLRHSIREKITDRESLQYAPLTTEGKKLAIEFGQLLPKDRTIRIFYSPILRCKETAQCVYKGVIQNRGSALIIGEKYFLGGTFIIKPELVIDMLTDLGVSRFVDQWFNRQLDKNVLIPPDMARKDLLNSIIQCNQNNHGEINIHISHDLNVILFKSLVYDVSTKDFRWPDYMEGVIFKKKNNQVILCLENKEKIIQIE